MLCRPKTPSLVCAGLVLSALGSTASSAQAATFDEVTGKLSLDAAVQVSFDDAASIAAFSPLFRDGEGESQTVDFVSTPSPLEGSAALSFGGDVTTGVLELAALPVDLVGHRIEVRLWQLPQGTRAAVGLLWGIGDLDQLFAPAGGLWMIGGVVLQPTGRATDDGWIEYSSGPVDFAAAGVLGPGRLMLADIRTFGSDETLATYDSEARVLIDALEIEDLGEALVPDVPCTLLNESVRCGRDGLCLQGRCVDGAIVAGAPPPDPQVGNDYLTRRTVEYQLFEGGRIPQAHMNDLAAALDGLRDDPGSAAFWPGFKAAVELLWDGHARAATMSSQFSTNLGVCLHLGHADLLPTGGTLPLVFELGADNPVTSQLQEGDALVAIDGQPPAVWTAAARRLLSYNGDPAGFELVVTPGLMGAAVATGAVLTFQRCSQGGPTPCQPAEVETITIDLSSLFGEEVWAGNPPDFHNDRIQCDYRFRRASSNADVKDYPVATVVDEGPIRTLIINGVPDYYSAQSWYETVMNALDPAPAHLLVDQRTGYGGTITTVDFLMGMLLYDEDFDHMRVLPFLEQPLDAAMWSELDQCLGPQWWNSSDCGGYFQWPLGDYVGLEDYKGIAGSSRVAVLNGCDVSGNDYTSKLFTYRSSATRIFGAAPSYGAFGPVWGLPVHVDEISGGRVQLYDTIFVRDSAEPLGEFETSHGVWPDELVWQRQSDAVQGTDTLIDAAKAWLLQE